MSERTIDQKQSIDEDLNWADYIDALRRQGEPREVLLAERIRGRRLRDRYLDHVTVFKLVRPRAAAD
jgi:hypothetical protein